MMPHLQLVCIVISILFLTITIYMCINSMSICFCPNYFDQKHSKEFKLFKMKIFTNIWGVKNKS